MELARSLLGVAAVLALLCALLWMGRKRGLLIGAIRSGPGGRTLTLVERLPLTANHSVHLLRAGDRTLLVGVHSSGFTVLCDLSQPKSKET